MREGHLALSSPCKKQPLRKWVCHCGLESAVGTCVHSCKMYEGGRALDSLSVSVKRLFIWIFSVKAWLSHRHGVWEKQ